MPHEMSIRLSGEEIEIRALVTAIRGMPDVHGMSEHQAVAAAHRVRGGAALSPEALDLRLHVADSLARDHVRGRIGTLASGAGVGLEWLDED